MTEPGVLQDARHFATITLSCSRLIHQTMNSLRPLQFAVFLCALLGDRSPAIGASPLSSPPQGVQAPAEEGRVDRLIKEGAVREAVVLFDADADRIRTFDPRVLQRLAIAVLAEVAGATVDRDASIEACLTLLSVGPHTCEPTITLNASTPASARLRVLARELPVDATAADRRLAEFTSAFSPDDWNAIVDAIDAFPPEIAIRLLRQALGSGSEGVQFGAVDRLSRMDHPSALPVLRSAIRDGRPGRFLALAAVARSGDKPALAALEASLPDLRGRDLLAAGVALAHLGRPGGYEAITHVLDGPDELLQLDAAVALIRLGDAAGRARLEAELASPNMWIRLRALEKAREVGLPPSALIWRHLADATPWVRVRAAQIAVAPPERPARGPIAAR